MKSFIQTVIHVVPSLLALRLFQAHLGVLCVPKGKKKERQNYLLRKYVFFSQRNAHEAEVMILEKVQ